MFFKKDKENRKKIKDRGLFYFENILQWGLKFF